MAGPFLLIVPETQDLGFWLQERLQAQGFAVASQSDPKLVPGVVRRGRPQLVILGDLTPSCQWSLQLAQELLQEDYRLPIILVARVATTTTLLAALRNGIRDFFQWPVAVEDLNQGIRRLLAAPAPFELEDKRHGLQMIGSSPALQEVLTQVRRAAASDSTVLITGETGTGKELAGELVHVWGERRRRPFVAVNCAAIPDSLVESELFGHEKGAFTGALARQIGKLEQASDGTLFLDEVGDLSLLAQAKMLRALDRREIYRLGGTQAIPLKLRLIAATNQDLETKMASGIFRADLYYRLNVLRISLPPLRERREDIFPLCNYFLAYFNRKLGRCARGWTPEALRLLTAYDWPGNVRELKNVVEASLVASRSTLLDLQDLPPDFRRRCDAGGLARPTERDRLLAALAATNWNKSKTAQQLSWSRMTLYRKLAKYQIFRPPDSGAHSR